MTGSTIAARVPLDLRSDLEAIAQRDANGGEPELTPVIRRALREYADRELGRVKIGRVKVAGRLFAPAEGASHRDDPATSRQAARNTAPRTGTDRRRILERFELHRRAGLTSDELLHYDELEGRRPAGNGPARRVSELKAAGAIEPLRDHDGDTVTRPTRTGNQATVYVITTKGREWLRPR